PGVGINFVNNRMESNDISLNLGDNDSYNGTIDSGVSFRSNTFAKLNRGAPLPHRSIVLGDWNHTVRNVRIIDNRYETGATSQLHFLGPQPKDISIGWNLKVTVESAAGMPIHGATVTVTDKDGMQVYTGRTGNDGCVSDIALISVIYRQA